MLLCYCVTNNGDNMKINCNQTKCKNCKEYHRCSLTQPTSQDHLLLLTEIEYWLNELKHAKKRLKEYATIVEDIQNHKYCYTVNVYGNIQYAPKQNVFGVTIQRPEHVFYGWNLNKLEKNVNDLFEHIRELRFQELELRKELIE